MLFKHRDPLNIFGCFFLFLLDCPLCKKLPHPEDPDHLLKMKLSYQTVLFATGRPICDDGDDDEDDDRDDDDHSSRCGTATRPPVAERRPPPPSLPSFSVPRRKSVAPRRPTGHVRLILVWQDLSLKSLKPFLKLQEISVTTISSSHLKFAESPERKMWKKGFLNFLGIFSLLMIIQSYKSSSF